MRVATDTSKQHRETIRRLAAESFSAHVVEDLGMAGGGLRAFRFARPGTGMYAVRIVVWPGWIIVAGDVGDTMFQHSEADSLGWLRRSLDDVRYMLGKVKGERKIFMLGDAAAFIQAEAARLRDGDHDAIRQARSLLDAWNPINDGECKFYQALRDHGVDDPPACTDWDSDHLWAIEALRHFVTALDAEPSHTQQEV